MRRAIWTAATVVMMLWMGGCGGDDVSIESGIALENMDTTVRIQDDAYTHVNGGWIERTVIPEDRASYSAFTETQERTEEQLAEIVEDLLGRAPETLTEEEKKIADLYRSYMDTEAIEAAGIAPLEDTLQAIGTVDSLEAMAPLMADLMRMGVDLPFGLFVDADAKDSDHYALYWEQDGLGLPNRDYYLEEGEDFVALRAAYQRYVEEILDLIGWPGEASVTAEAVVALESRMAQEQWSEEENRDVLKTYNKMPVSDLDALLGDFNYTAYMRQAGMERVTEVIVEQPSYAEALGSLFPTTAMETWQAYLAFHLVDCYAPYLGEAYASRHFDFHERTLQGIETAKSRDRLAINLLNTVLGESFGKLYVERYFPPEAKEKVDRLVDRLIESYDRSIDTLTWMGEATKAAAKEKLHKIRRKIGYPDTWKSYEGLTIAADDLAGNMIRYYRFESGELIADIGEPVDRDRWYMLPQTVNAYYDPTANEVVFPAAILQPPFFDMHADMAVNYGAIGSVIGHELSHGFDDMGSKYDGDGNLNDWWTAEDAANFAALGQRLVAQYDAYEPLPGYHINGELTLGENLADLSGVEISYKAYKLSLEGKPSRVIDGLTGEQRFFIGWAQIWRNKMREEELLRRLLIDPHSPAPYRVNGVFVNLDAFYEAFDVQPGDAMYKPPAERIVVW